jgi:CRP-like cAMP-binding protein
MKNKAIENFLAALEVHMPLTEKIKDKLLPGVLVRQFKKNSALSNFRNDYLFVSNGTLKKEDGDSGDVLLFLEAGDFELFGKADESFHYITLEESTIVLFPGELIVDLLAESKQFIPGYQTIVHNWSALRCRRQDLLLLPASKRKAELYTRMGKSLNSIPNKDLARYLNMDTSYFSRLPV